MNAKIYFSTRFYQSSHCPFLLHLASISRLDNYGSSLPTWWEQLSGLMGSMKWSSLHARLSVMSSDEFCDSFAKFTEIVVISAIVSWHCGHKIWRFHDYGLWPGQVMTHSAKNSTLSLINVNVMLSLHASFPFHPLIGTDFNTRQSYSCLHSQMLHCIARRRMKP